MPNAHRAYRPHSEVEFLDARDISLEEAIKGLEQSIALSAQADEAPTSRSTKLKPAQTGSAMISYERVPHVLKSLKEEWTAASASDRSNDCFREVRGRLTMHMHPYFLGERLMQGMREAAGHLLMRQNRVLQLVPLGFKELKPANQHAAVVGESAYIHFLIEFRCIGFRPRVGMNIIGRLGDVQTAVGINCTVFNNFNFFVPKDDLPQGAWFDGDESVWMSGQKGEKELVGDRTRPLCLKMTQPVKEESGSQPVNFKGVLADQLKPAGSRSGGDTPGSRGVRSGDAAEPPKPPKKKRKSSAAGVGAAAETPKDEAGSSSGLARKSKSSRQAEAGEDTL